MTDLCLRNGGLQYLPLACEPRTLKHQFALGIPFVGKLNIRFWMCHEFPQLKVFPCSPCVLRMVFHGADRAHGPLRVTVHADVTAPQASMVFCGTVNELPCSAAKGIHQKPLCLQSFRQTCDRIRSLDPPSNSCSLHLKDKEVIAPDRHRYS